MARPRARAEAALRESEERFRVSFANASIGFLMTSPDGRFLDANPAYCAITGYSPEELRNLPYPLLVHPEDRAAAMARMRRCSPAKAPAMSSRTVMSARTGPASGCARASRSFATTIRPRWIIRLVEDVTARVQAERALREADRSKDVFLATLAHELRNPLSPIRSGLRDPATRRGRRTEGRKGARHDGAPGPSSGAAGRRPHGSFPHQPRTDRAAKGARRAGADRERRGRRHAAARSPTFAID